MLRFLVVWYCAYVQDLIGRKTFIFWIDGLASPIILTCVLMGGWCNRGALAGRILLCGRWVVSIILILPPFIVVPAMSDKLFPCLLFLFVQVGMRVVAVSIAAARAEIPDAHLFVLFGDRVVDSRAIA